MAHVDCKHYCNTSNIFVVINVLKISVWASCNHAMHEEITKSMFQNHCNVIFFALEWATFGKRSIRKSKKMSVFMYLLYICMDAVCVYEWLIILCMKAIVVSSNLRYFYSVLDEKRHWSRWLLHYSS
jgi:hypothetical protein